MTAVQAGQLTIAFSVLGVAFLAVIAYGVRWVIKGRARFERIDRQRGTLLLRQELMEIGYWSLDPLAKALAARQVHPAVLSYGSAVLAMISGIALSFGHFGTGALFSMISSSLDLLDGHVARLSGKVSRSGELLDSVMDRCAEFFFFLGLIVYYRKIPWILILTCFAWFGSYMVSYSTAKAELMRVSLPPALMRRPERAVYLALGAILSPVTIPWWRLEQEYAITLKQALGIPMVAALWLVAVLSIISAFQRFRRCAEKLVD